MEKSRREEAIRRLRWLVSEGQLDEDTARLVAEVAAALEMDARTIERLRQDVEFWKFQHKCAGGVPF